jgi:hypothetical protein
MRRRSTLFGLVVCVLGVAAASAARADSASDAEKMVSERYYEGVPYWEASALDGDAVKWLAQMLRDPAESEHHANIVMALGMSGRPAAFEALRRYANQPLDGEVDRDTYRAQTRVRLAMGHLARSDQRALRWLLDEVRKPESDPGWSFRYHHGQRLAAILREQALTGLGISGAGEAADALDRAVGKAKGSDVLAERRRRHARHARLLRDRVATEGPDAVFGEEVGQ